MPVDGGAPPSSRTSRYDSRYDITKTEAETVYTASLDWGPTQKKRVVACLRIHEVEIGVKVLRQRGGSWQDAAVRELWRWFKPIGTARACLVSVEGGGGDKSQWLAARSLSIAAPGTTLDTTSSRQARRFLPPGTGLRDDWIKSSEGALDMAEKAERKLGRSHHDEQYSSSQGDLLSAM